MSRPFADRKERRRQKRLFLGVIVMILAYAFFVGDHRPHHLGLLYIEERRAQERIADLRSEHAELTVRRERIEGDTHMLETLARDKGMIRPGDLVYRIVPVPAETDADSLDSLRGAPDRPPRDD